MTDKGLFLQNVIAVIWDFDRTLSPQYMQKPLFEAYDVDENTFWEQVGRLPAYYRKAGIHVQRDTCYLGHILSYVRAGRFKGLTNARLRDLGKNITFYRGLPFFLDRLKTIVKAPDYAEGDLRLEHYVVSTGLAEIIRGSEIAEKLDGVWASEFIETPAEPDTDLAGAPAHGEITQIATLLDNTTKTRALFEINKGVNKEPSITVNDAIPEEERRVPFKNMIYVADGPSDIPSFSVVRKHGGLAFAVYKPRSPRHYEQALMLQETDRVDMIGPADYREGSSTDMWFQSQIRRIASRMLDERRRALESKVRKEPVHLAEIQRQKKREEEEAEE